MFFLDKFKILFLNGKELIKLGEVNPSFQITYLGCPSILAFKTPREVSETRTEMTAVNGGYNREKNN